MFGHVADIFAELERVLLRIESEHSDRAARLPQQPEQDSDEGALAGAVGADEPDDARLQIDGHRVEGGDARILLGQLTGADQGHEGGVGVSWPDGCRHYPKHQQWVSAADDFAFPIT